MTKAKMAYCTSGDDLDDRNELILGQLQQVYYLASRIRERLPKSVDIKDLVQVGVLGLLEAYRN